MLNIKIPAELPIAPEDECVIFGNALDNAIEACEKLPDNKYIDISVVLNKDTLMCKISNPFACDVSMNGVTSKTDVKNHGLGKESIDMALNKYNSVSRVSCENNIYTLFIVIMGLGQ